MQPHPPLFPVRRKNSRTPLHYPFILILCLLLILSLTRSYLFQSCKSTLQILDDIVDMLCTDGQTDGVWLDTLICQFLSR